jgi:hypothetical protein
MRKRARHSVPAPLTARKLRSPQDLNRPRPLARLTPSCPPRRSMFASTTRPIRHSTPLPLSIVARPHEAGPIRSWRADSLTFVWLDPGITPCCKSGFAQVVKISAGCRRRFRVRSGGTSSPHAKCIGDLGSATTAMRIGDPGALQVLAKNSDRCSFRLFQQYPPNSRHCSAPPPDRPKPKARLKRTAAPPDPAAEKNAGARPRRNDMIPLQWARWDFPSHPNRQRQRRGRWHLKTVSRQVYSACHWFHVSVSTTWTRRCNACCDWRQPTG